MLTWIRNRVFVSWKTTVAGLIAAAGSFFVDVAHGVGEQLISVVDPTALSWPDFRARLLKAGVIALVGALWHTKPKEDPKP
jgi:hypothetical protein